MSEQAFRSFVPSSAKSECYTSTNLMSENIQVFGCFLTHRFLQIYLLKVKPALNFVRLI